MGWAIEAERGEQVRHVVLIAEIKVEAADLLHGALMKVVFKGPQLRQAGRQLPALCAPRYLESGER